MNDNPPPGRIDPNAARESNQGEPREGGEPRRSTGPVARVNRHVDDEWRRWIAENLMAGVDTRGVLDGMIASGVYSRQAFLEVDLALSSPHVRGAERLRQQLRDLDDLLTAYRRNHRRHSKSGVIERRHRLSREELLVDYYVANRPVLITGMMDEWPALTRWNLEYFAGRLGDLEVKVRMGRGGGDGRIEREKPIASMRFSEFVERARTLGSSGDFYLTAQDKVTNAQVVARLWDDVVQIPDYLDVEDRLAGSFFLGPPGSTIPFRHDLANQMMAQAVGRRRVKLAPSWDLPLMRNDFHCYSQVDGRRRAAATDPPPGEPQVLECVVEPGEILFVPVGWMHFVEAIDLSATVSFTNFLFDNDFASFYSTYDLV